ncbi:PREDICTED: probable galactinol--sucrose galactosyltransferase 4 [Camelina sativa]|uniref:Probable galactinol--sucrose galactosyltransferase 4 n=1 Tax=Camelina sativa TaxID=90675 RepID=A0ABM0T8X9_CAMSA|nr:PREDICTED: probable galactinol--sucrose galactosyltransferase 4 [Camelina sativa]
MAPLNDSLASINDVIETKPLGVPQTKPTLQSNSFNLSQGVLRAKDSSPILFDVPQNVTFTPFAPDSISTDAPVPILLRVQANAHKGGFLGFTNESPSDLLTNSLGRFENREFLSVFRFKMWWSTAWIGKSGSDIQAETQWVMLKIPEIDSYVAIIPIIEGPFRAVLHPGEKGNVLICAESGSTQVKESSFNSIAYVHICDNPYNLMREAFSALRVHMNTFKLLEEKKLPKIVDKFGWCTWDACYLTVDPATIWTGVKELEDGGVCPKFIIIDDGWQSINFGDELDKDAENLVLGGEQMTARLTSFKECKKFRNYKGGSFITSDASHFDPHKPKMIIYKATERIQAIILRRKLVRECGEQDLHELDEKIKILSEELNAMFDVVENEESLGSEDASGTGMEAFTRDLRTRFKSLDDIYVWHALCGAWNGVRPETLTHLKAKVVPFDNSPSLDGTMTDLAVDKIEEAGIGLVHPSKAHEFYDSMHSYLASVGVTGAKIDVFQTLESVAEEHGGRVELAKAYYNGLTESMIKNFNGTEVIASMQQCNEFFFLATKQISIGRVGDDFWWQDPNGDPQGVYWLQGVHMIHCSYNSFWMGHMIQPDWDMFQSDHVCAEYHAASRAICGGPVYLSDHLGKASHNFDLIKKLVFSDGTIPRCIHYALPTRDSLFKNPLFDSESILKIFNFNKFGGVIGAFNCQGAGWSPKDHVIKGYKECYTAVSGTVHVSDIEWDQNPEAAGSQVSYTGDYLVYKQQSEEILFMNSKSDAIKITLEPSAFDLFSFVPVTELGSAGVRFAPLGLINMFNCVGTVQNMEVTGDNIVRVDLKGEGSFMSYSSVAPVMCYLNDKEAEFKWAEETGKLSFYVPWVEQSGGISHLSFTF